MNLTLLFFRRYLFSDHAGSVVRTIARICLGGIILGVIAMIIVMSVMNGFGDSIRNRLLAVEPHLVIKFSPNASKEEISSLEQLVRNTLEKITKDHNSQKSKSIDLHPFDKQDVILRSVEGSYTGGIALGSSPEGLKKILQKVEFEFSEDEPEDHSSEGLRKNEVYIGVDLARQLGVFAGNDLTLISPEDLLLPEGEVPAYETVHVKAILRTNVSDYDNQMLFYTRDDSLKRLQTSASLERGIEVRFLDESWVDEAAAQLHAKNFLVETWKERNSALFYSLKMEKLMMGLFLGLTLLISSFAIVIVLFLLIAQKKKDTGMLMTMGLSAKQSEKLFTQIGLLLSGLGGFIGLTLGLTICVLWQKYPLIKLPDIYYDTRIPVRVDYVMVAGMTIVGGVIAYFGARIPSRRNRVDYPIQALVDRENE